MYGIKATEKNSSITGEPQNFLCKTIRGTYHATSCSYWMFNGTIDECARKLDKFKAANPTAYARYEFEIVPMPEKYKADILADKAYKARMKRKSRLEASLGDDESTLVVMSEKKKAGKADKAFFALAQRLGLTPRQTNDGRMYISVKIA